ncbi:hypothetical protein HDV06_006850 [Boothiomyces sp. JEL0866]|nr:hypothetical protein HDV06_006850 [Boothiomyces sp. JEL0866]
MKLKAKESERKLQSFNKYQSDFSNTITIQKHRQVWLEEIQRLQHWRKIFLLSIQNHFVKFDKGEELNWYWHREIADMSDADLIREDVMGLHYISKDMHHSSKSNRVLQEKIQEQREKIQEAIAKDDKKIRKIEKEIREVDQTGELIEINDEWIEFNGEIMRFRNLKFKHQDLQRHHTKECGRIKEMYEQELLRLNQSYQDVIERLPYGYLDEITFDHFEKIKEEYSDQTKEKFTMFCERVHLEIPKLSQKEEEAAIKAEMEYQKCKEEQLHKMEKRHQTLKQWREQKITMFILHSEKRKKYHQEQLQKEQALHQKEQKRRESIKFHLELYKEELEKKKKKQMELELELNEKLEAEYQIQKAINEERVKVRATERQKKLKEKEKQYELMLKERQELERRLEILRQSVAVHAESDWSRTTKDTTSFMKHREKELQSQWYKTIGYSSEEILKDNRMKISIALHRNGLANSKYGNQVLQSMQPPVKRPDQISTIKFE